MGHPATENKTPLSFEPLFLNDEHGAPLLVSVMKAAYFFEASGELAPAEEKAVINFAGQLNGEPGKSSYKYEPECAFTKLTTDVVIVGHAYLNGAQSVDVAVRVGPLEKTIRVVGDRYWIKSLGAISMTDPERCETIPLIYERSFGGWDRSHPDPDKHAFDPRNPVGTGFRSKMGKFEDGVRLPNLEDPRDPVRCYGDAPPPIGFGFISPDWQPRAGFSGTYDAAWMQDRMPLLPAGFDRRFFNAASPGLVARDYLRGDEPVWIGNMSPGGAISFQLPGLPTPECHVRMTGGHVVKLHANLDTVVIDADEKLLVLTWRGYTPVRRGPHDVISVDVFYESFPH